MSYPEPPAQHSNNAAGISPWIIWHRRINFLLCFTVHFTAPTASSSNS